MRVFITSTPEELEPHRLAALDVVQDLGLEPVVRDPPAGRGVDAVRARAREVAAADLVLAIVGWRRGHTPPPELGGDGRRPWVYWEVKSAVERRKPMVALMAAESFRPQLREDDAGAHALMLDFRGELTRLAAVFDDEPPPEDGSQPLAGFRDLVRRNLAEAGRAARSSSAAVADARLRRWPPPRRPDRPYPLLLPYDHPDLMAGRERDLEDLRHTLRKPVLITGLYAPSGMGKSSLVAGGLVPALRAEGHPAALVRQPLEPGIAGWLLGDLLEADADALSVADEDARGFVDRLLAVRRLAGDVPPVLVVDQFEGLLRHAPASGGAPQSRAVAVSQARRARAVVGALLAASAQHLPGLVDPPCRWLLVYRQELHGELLSWLTNVLGDARDEALPGIEELPHDLSEPARFHGWPLLPLATPAPGSEDPAGEAAAVFLAAIEKPLELTVPAPTPPGHDGGPPSRRQYPWRFAPGHAARLARAFGAARAAAPKAPLVPELQVVLARLLEQAGEPRDGAEVTVEVPEEPGELIDQALEKHLMSALDAAFPAGRSRETRLRRTRALLALRELADVQGRRNEGLPAESLARAIGEEGREVMAKLATPRTRLVLLEQHDDEWVYALSHDRMAEVLVRLVDEGRWAGLGIDGELLSLRRFVALESELFASGDVAQATAVPSAPQRDLFRRIEAHADALLWGEERRRWWQACRARRRAERRRTLLRRAAVALAVSATALGVWRWTDLRARRAALFEQVAAGEPEVAFAAADRLLVEWQAEPEALREALRHREKPLDLLERGIGGVPPGEGREEAVLRLAEVALPLITDDAPAGRLPEDPVRIASLVWALDFFAPEGERTRSLRDRTLEPLRRQRPPPPMPAADVPPEGDERGHTGWANIPAGTFWMGSGPGEGRDGEDKLDERPRHRVTLSAFRMGIHEVTNAEFRRLYPEHAEGRDDRLPAAGMTWYHAYTYAAWLGGRLPTEAEAEYASRAGCRFAYCRRDANEASLDDVAWWVGNATDPETSEPGPRPVAQLEPNPWGLFDVYGNVWEFCADWYGAYRAEDQVDPPGPTTSGSDYRLMRGGSVFEAAEWVVASGRGVLPVGHAADSTGFRVVLQGP